MRSDLLSNLALRAEGLYVAAKQGSDSLARLYATHIANLPRRQIDARSSRVAAQRFQWFVLGALTLLGVEMFGA